MRGEVSDGMILAEDEVGLGTDHAGSCCCRRGRAGDAARATCCRSSTTCSLVESTGNRPDLQSVYGLAREIAALYDLPLAAMSGDCRRDTSRRGRVEIEIDDFDGCPRYIGRLFEDVTIGPSPVWLRARLHAAGMRPISNVVDVTNYVMLALGNPLHAFDFDDARAAAGSSSAARAPGERLRTLDGVDRDARRRTT